jgi:hypothetical protein
MATPSKGPIQDNTAALKDRIAELEAKLTKQSTITFKVSEKGAVSAYGLGRFPVTLYREQWERVIAKAGELTAYIKANESKLKTKEEAATAKAAA